MKNQKNSKELKSKCMLADPYLEDMFYIVELDVDNMKLDYEQ